MVDPPESPRLAWFLADARRALLRAGDEEPLLELLSDLAVRVGGFAGSRVVLGQPSTEGEAFPLRDGERVLGVWTVTGTLGPTEREAMCEIAADLAHWLASTRARREATERLERLVLALDQIGEGIFQFEGGSPAFVYVNRSAAESLGYSKEALVGGMTIGDIDPSWTAEGWAQFIPEIRANRRMTIETVHRRADGETFPVEVSGTWFEHGGREFNLAVSRDIRARREAERALRTSEAAYRSLVENSPDFIVRWDRSLARVLVNASFAEALGQPVSTLVAGRFGAGHPESAAKGLALVHAAILRTFDSGEGSLVVLPFHAKDGVRTVQLRLVPERGVGGEVETVLGMARDISPLVQTERELRTLSEHLPDLLFRFDADGHPTYANPAVARAIERSAPGALYAALAGPVRDAVASGSPAQFSLHVPYDDGVRELEARLVPERSDEGPVESVLAILRDVTHERRAQAAVRQSEERFRQVTENIDEAFWLADAATGEVIYVSPVFERLFGRPSAEAGRWRESVHPDDRGAIDAGGSVHEYRITRAEGVRWIRQRTFPILDDRGRVYRRAYVADDVTKRRELEEELRQSQKMEAVGQLAGGIAHDFNNLLAAMRLQASYLLDRVHGSPELGDGLSEILATTERAANLTRQLLTFSRRKAPNKVPTDIGRAVEQMMHLLRRVLGEQVSVDVSAAPDLPLIAADQSMLELVLMNLALNARDAMKGGGRLTLRLSVEAVGAEQAAVHGASSGAYVLLEVVDTGTGIPPHHLPRIFEPFFTTKPIGQGTGLGLATVFGIVRQHDGWIEVETAEGVGTTFRVYLPAGPGGAGVRTPAPTPPRPRGGAETILLVEDEASVRSVAQRVLQGKGYHVLTATSADAALALWREASGRVDLLLTDLSMPGRSGQELSAELRGHHPALRILYMTGYDPAAAPVDGRRLLHKPFGAAELAAAVRVALDEP